MRSAAPCRIGSTRSSRRRRWLSWPPFSASSTPRRLELLEARQTRQAELSAGGTLDFLPETRHVRESDWQRRPARSRSGRPPRGDHRPGGPQDDDQRARTRAPRSGSPTSRTPTLPPGKTPSAASSTCGTRWTGRSTSRPAARATRSGPMTSSPPSWSARAAGTWTEKHLTVDGVPFSGSLVRLRALLLPLARSSRSTRARAPTSTCRRWNPTWRPGSGTTSSSAPRTCSVFPRARSGQRSSSRPIPAAFEMEEILYELRDHSAGLNAGAGTTCSA